LVDIRPIVSVNGRGVIQAMKGKIYLLDDQAQLTPLEEVAYDSERLLQGLLADHPDLLAGDQMDSADPLRWLLVTREMSVPDEVDGSKRWSLDHLFLDHRGVPTLVEVKRSSDTRIRREVVGQLLDYAANAVVHWPTEEIRAAFANRCAQDEVDPEEELARLLDDAEDAEDYWQRVKTNLQAGNIRIVFLADEIPRELRRVVEFLNEQMDPAEVLAVEVKRFVGDGVATLVPRVVGQTETALQKKSPRGSARTMIGESEFLAHVAGKRPADERAVFEQVIAWARKEGLDDHFSTGAKGFKFAPMLGVGDRPIQPIDLHAKGWVRLRRTLKRHSPFDDPIKRDQLLQRIQALPSLVLTEYGMEGSPKLLTSGLKSKEQMSCLLAALSWLVAELRASHAAGPRDEPPI
jgi:hypothetical protein